MKNKIILQGEEKYPSEKRKQTEIVRRKHVQYDKNIDDNRERNRNKFSVKQRKTEEITFTHFCRLMFIGIFPVHQPGWWVID